MKPVLAALIALALVAGAAAAPRSLKQTLSGQPSTNCETLVVGGGPGGVYSAYRVLESKNSTNVCLLEATGRVGGRIYSVRGLGAKQDLVVDMGAYRYMPLVQKLITDIIEGLLQLPNRLYQPGVEDYKVILSTDGSNAGFATYVEKLLDLGSMMGLKTHFNTKVISVNTTADGTFKVTAGEGQVFTANRVILNLPTRPMHRLLQSSNIETNYNTGLYAPEHNRATKLYLYYPQAWWLAAGLNNGSFAATSAFGPGNVTIPLVARYHDGHVRCNTSSGAVDYYYTNNAINPSSCYGYLQAVYTSASSASSAPSQAAIAYLVDYMGSSSTDVPYKILDGSTALGAKLLADSHASILKWHNANNLSTAAMAASNALPSHAVVAMWDQAVSWVGGGWNGMKDSKQGTPDAVAASGVIHPFPGIPLYVANEAYGPATTQGWSEASLVLAENIIQGYFGGGQPSWMRNTTLPAVIFGPNWNDYESAQQGGGTIVINAKPPAPAPAPAVSAFSTSG
ncbi:hypothetical protein WJX72_002466 [[Myrmecia] bisecta]|uniref:monoamine oxidase n=1 Tax=[Myrmecia] bisecta TaxID=41462 RepID=A0AAW1QPE5_9CHLO